MFAARSFWSLCYHGRCDALLRRNIGGFQQSTAMASSSSGFLLQLFSLPLVVIFDIVVAGVDATESCARDEEEGRLQYSHSMATSMQYRCTKSCTCAKSTCANNNRNPHAHAQQKLAYVSDLVHRCWLTNEEAEYQSEVIDYGYQSQLDKDEYHSKYPCTPHMSKIFFSTSTHNPESSGLLQPSRDTIATMLRAEAIRTWTTKAFIATLLGAVLTIFLLSGGKEHDDSLVRVVAPE
jgi:hypothetical protein